MGIFLFSCYCIVLVINDAAGNAAPDRVTRIAKDNITLVAILQNTPFSLANEFCFSVGAEVINRLFFNIAVDFFKTLNPFYEKFWLGAFFKNDAWIWNDGTHLTLNNFPQINAKGDNKTCLIYNKLIDKVEETDCFNKYSTVCDYGGGIGFGKLLLVLIRKHIVPIPKTKMLFVVDNDITTGYKTYESTLQFIKNLANTVILNQNRSFGIEWYSSDASIINFKKNSSNCFVRTELDGLFRSKLASKHTLAIYYNAFKAAEQEMANNNNESNVFLFFFAVRPDSGPVEDRNKIVNKIKDMGVKIIVITLGDEIIGSNLEEIASTIDGQLQLYVFDTMKNFREATEFLRSKRKFSWNDCFKVGVRSRFLYKPAKQHRCF